MHERTDKHKSADPLKHELENATISRPAWALDHHSPRSSDETDSKTIPKSLIDVILEVVAKSIEQVLAEVMVRCVAASVEQKIRPLVEELALLRIAIEHDWDSSNRRRRGTDADEEKE